MKRTMCALVLCVVLYCLRLVRTESVTEETVLLSNIETVVDSVVKLPCNLTPPIPQDHISLVIWYKDGAKSPIYSMDVRGRALDQSIHWFDDRLFSGRAFYSADPPSSFLTLENVMDTDAGVYKCRVDFKHSPTRNYIINLTVIVPPKTLTLIDNTGSVIERAVIGPVSEGSSLEITCIARGGIPTPRVTWWEEGVLVDDSDSTGTDQSVSNTYLLHQVTRQNFGSTLTCQAINSPYLAPLTATLSVQVFLPPLDVKIVDERKALSAGSEYDLTCHSSGSRPPATITWWKGGKRLNAPTKVSTSNEGNLTICTVTYAAEVTDAGLSLACRASNPHVPASALEDTWTIQIYFLPIVKVELGSNINGSSVKEGMDVYFECNIKANPRVRKVIWMHEGHVVHNNASAGTILSNQTLVLQSVTRRSSGAYTCIAGNREGDSESKPFNLDVKFEPRCRPSQQRVYGASRLEEFSVVCEVDANPPADLFRWRFNNSAIQSRDIENFVSDKGGGGRSIATYMTRTETDYGTLLCWGRNALGPQSVPCVFHVVPAGRPDAPYNCSASNRSQTWIQVICAKGFDGGLPQQFVAEVRDINGRLVSNVTSRNDIVFTVMNLMPGAMYAMSVYSRNGKGRSLQTANITFNTLEQVQVQVERRSTDNNEKDMESVVLLTGIISGILFLISVIFITVICLRRNSRPGLQQRGNKQLEKARSQILAQAPVNFQPEDEKNPDVIPQKLDVEIASSGIAETTKDKAPNSSAPAWEPAIPIIFQTHVVPERGLPNSWQIAAWPSGPIIKNAETQTPAQRHKESTV